ncbi:MAG: SPOR domain-containing protein [Gammaproteobacteria bacterium]|nr:SPOR domain-containing protein [Gammaproteobacteria bacterium]
MPQDYARKHKPAASKRPQAAGRNSPGNAPSPRKWFFAGLSCGVFLSALVWLAGQQPELVKTVVAVGDAVSDQDTAPKPTFDFYTLLPEQQVEVDVEPLSAEQQSRSTPIDQYLLQAGSFQRAEDADRRRGELILLDLEARVQETQGSNGRWFRVYIGPFESRSQLEKARSLTAQQDIDTLLLKRPGQG